MSVPFKTVPFHRSTLKIEPATTEAMLRLHGLTCYIEIKDYRGRDEEYKALIARFVEQGRSFAIIRGRVYMTDGAALSIKLEG